MFKNHSLQTQGIILALFAMLTFSINDGIFKFAMGTMSMDVAVAMGYFFSTLFLVAYALFKKNPLMPQRKRNAIIYGGLFLLEQICFIFSLKYLPIAELFVVVLSTPVAVLIMSSLFLKENLSRQQILAVLSGFAGALLVVSIPLLSPAENTNLAVDNVIHWAWISAILNVLLGSSKIIYLRKYCQTENTISLSIFSNIFIMLFFMIKISPGDISTPPFECILLLLGGILGGWGCATYIRAFQIAKAPLISATQYSQIIWALLMGVFIFNEQPTAAGICGSLLIIVSGYFLYLKKSED